MFDSVSMLFTDFQATDVQTCQLDRFRRGRKKLFCVPGRVATARYNGLTALKSIPTYLQSNEP